jgi:hypothetical protein
MKILKPTRPTISSSRAASGTQPSSSYEPAPGRHFEDSRKKLPSTIDSGYSEPRTSVSGDGKPLMKTKDLGKASNPIGGASAFAWLNSNQQKRSATTAE